MRDPKRIKPILEKIEAIWTQSPDLRLCQLIGNCFPAGDNYYVEDNILDEKLSTLYKTQLLKAPKKNKKGFFKRHPILFILFILFLLFAAKTVFAEDIIVNAKAEHFHNRTLKTLREIDPKIKLIRNEYSVFLLRSTSKDFCKKLRAKQRKQKKPRLSCSYNLPVHFCQIDIPIIDDTYYNDQWNLGIVHAQEAWTLTIGSKNSFVAVMDTGIDYDNTDLSPNIWMKDYSNVDNHFHGTAVSSIIGSQGNNGFGIAGINWSTNIIPVKIIQQPLTYDLISGMNYVIGLKNIGIPIRAINASYGRPTFDQTEYDVIQKAQNAGIIIVAAAGNDGWNSDEKSYYPMGYDLDNIISVGSIGQTLEKSYFSNYGHSIDIVAPGEKLLVAKLGNGIMYSSGTSFSAPHVTGAITLLDSYTGGYLTWQELKQTILETATEYSHLEPYVNRGRVLNVYNALQRYQFHNMYKPINVEYHLVKFRIKNTNNVRVKLLIQNNITKQVLAKSIAKRNYDIVLPRGLYQFSIANNKRIKPTKNRSVFLISEKRIEFKIILKKKKK